MRLLLLTSTLPWPLEMHGGAQRTALLLEALQSVAQVDLALVARTGELADLGRQAQASGDPIVGIFHVPQHDLASPSGIAKLPLIGKPIATSRKYLARYRRNPALSAWLNEIVESGTYDGVVSRFLFPGAAAGLRAVSGIPKMLDWDDLDHLKVRSQIEADQWRGVRARIAKALVLSQLKRFCLAEAAAYDHVWVAKPGDASALPGMSVSVLPNIPFSAAGHTRTDRTDRHTILFVGNQTYLPNSDALTRFLDTAWASVRLQCPSARLLAIGPSPVADVAARWRTHAGVEIVGTVDDLTPFYEQAALSICPVEWGGGSNIKAVESLGYGVPCVVSPYSYDAFKADLTSDTGMICAGSAQQYARACIRLLKDSNHSIAIGRAGQEVVRKRYSRARFRQVTQAGLSNAGIAL